MTIHQTNTMLTETQILRMEVRTKGLRVALWVISGLEIMYTNVMNTLLYSPASLECYSSLSSQTLLAPGSKDWGYTLFHRMGSI